MSVVSIREVADGRLRRGNVKKHVAAIHVSGKLSLLQRKVSNVLLLNAYDDLLTKPLHRIEARTLSVMVGYDSNPETPRRTMPAAGKPLPINNKARYAL